MKRIAFIVLTFFYLASCIGVGTEQFYCCGKLTSVSLSFGGTNRASDKASGKGRCCKNEKQSFKLKDTQLTPAAYTFSQPLPLILPPFSSYDPETGLSALPLNIAYQSNAPPLQRAIPIYALYCTYRI